MPNTDYLAIYLNDHLAGATGGVELARRARDSNRGDEAFAEPLRRICEEIEQDRVTLEAITDRLGISRSRVKPLGAWVAEKVGRLKLNGQLRGYSPLSRVLELEGLMMGITGKAALWDTLARSGVAAGPEADFEVLRARAGQQRDAVAGLHDVAVIRLD